MGRGGKDRNDVIQVAVILLAIRIQFAEIVLILRKKSIDWSTKNCLGQVAFGIQK